MWSSFNPRKGLFGFTGIPLYRYVLFDCLFILLNTYPIILRPSLRSSLFIRMGLRRSKQPQKGRGKKEVDRTEERK